MTGTGTLCGLAWATLVCYTDIPCVDDCNWLVLSGLKVDLCIVATYIRCVCVKSQPGPAVRLRQFMFLHQQA